MNVKSKWNEAKNKKRAHRLFIHSRFLSILRVTLIERGVPFLWASVCMCLSQKIFTRLIISNTTIFSADCRLIIDIACWPFGNLLICMCIQFDSNKCLSVIFHCRSMNISSTDGNMQWIMSAIEIVFSLSSVHWTNHWLISWHIPFDNCSLAFFSFKQFTIIKCDTIIVYVLLVYTFRWLSNSCQKKTTKIFLVNTSHCIRHSKQWLKHFEKWFRFFFFSSSKYYFQVFEFFQANIKQNWYVLSASMLNWTCATCNINSTKWKTENQFTQTQANKRILTIWLRSKWFNYSHIRGESGREKSLNLSHDRYERKKVQIKI